MFAHLFKDAFQEPRTGPTSPDQRVAKHNPHRGAGGLYCTPVEAATHQDKKHRDTMLSKVFGLKL